MIIYKEESLKFFEYMTEKKLKELMAHSDGARIVLAKRNLNITGDVYVDGALISNLELHNKNYEENCQTIEEAMASYKLKKEQIVEIVEEGE